MVGLVVSNIQFPHNRRGWEEKEEALNKRPILIMMMSVTVLGSTLDNSDYNHAH